MIDDDKPVAYLLVSDPEDLPSLPPPESLALPGSKRRILIGDDLQTQLLIDTNKLTAYLENLSQYEPDPFHRIWNFVRRGDEEALREFPFLLTAGRLGDLIDSGQVAPRPIVTGLPQRESVSWKTEDSSRKPSLEVASLAHRFGPVFSLARFIHENRSVPRTGTNWQVNAHLLEEVADAKAVWHEYTCEIVLSEGLIAQAKEAARRYALNPHPLGWITTWKNISLIIGDQEEDRKGFRTEEHDMRNLCMALQEMYDSLSQTAAGAAILQYFIEWNVHIPVGKSKALYHGLCHGFRISQDVSQLLMRIVPDSREVLLLEQLFEYLAGAAAAACRGEDINLPVPSLLEKVLYLPEHIANAVPTPFEIGVQDIELLASKVDQGLLGKVGPLDTPDTGRTGEPVSAPVLESGYSTSFYEGVIHAMAVSEKVMAIYERDILPLNEHKIFELEAGSHRVCCMAARHWTQAIHGSDLSRTTISQ